MEDQTSASQQAYQERRSFGYAPCWLPFLLSLAAGLLVFHLLLLLMLQGPSGL